MVSFAATLRTTEAEEELRTGHGDTAALRIFPGGWPIDQVRRMRRGFMVMARAPLAQPVSFTRIRTKGAFLVSASAVGRGEGLAPAIYSLEIEVTVKRAEPCRVVDPFRNSTSLPTVFGPDGPVAVTNVPVDDGMDARFVFTPNSTGVFVVRASAGAAAMH